MVEFALVTKPALQIVICAFYIRARLTLVTKPSKVTKAPQTPKTPQTTFSDRCQLHHKSVVCNEEQGDNHGCRLDTQALPCTDSSVRHTQGQGLRKPIVNVWMRQPWLSHPRCDRNPNVVLTNRISFRYRDSVALSRRPTREVLSISSLCFAVCQC